MTLSLILLAGALSILYSTKLTSAENERVARIQEAGRTALELIRQDARASGYVGCSRPHNASYGCTYTTTGLSSNTLLWDFSKPVYGFEATGGAWTPALDAAIPASPAPAAGSDVLVLRTARAGSPMFRTNAGASGSAAISVDRDPNILCWRYANADDHRRLPERSEVFVATAAHWNRRNRHDCPRDRRHSWQVTLPVP